MAKELEDWLVISIHRDECCAKKNGYCFMPLEDRLAVIEAIRYVDEVVICNSPCDLTTAMPCERLNLTFLRKEAIELRRTCQHPKLSSARGLE